MFVGYYDEFRTIEDNEKASQSYEEIDLHGKETDTSKELVEPVKAIEYIHKMELPKKRFCEYCSLEQPYRSKHCKECERCVRKYDHHCFWIGGCVGELNHRKFYLFLFFQTINFLQCFKIVSEAVIDILGTKRLRYENKLFFDYR